VGNRSREVYSASTGTTVGANASNYRIKSSDHIGAGSLKQKFRQNVTAILALRKIELENRTATPEEKAALVKYVGWGGMPQAFAEVPPDDWRNENQQIRNLLDKEEFEAARASTLNAHYTPSDVIKAMYAGLERLGFDGGRILEPSCGLGHFIGLLPEAIQARSSITGIELDSVTARMAQKLYPDADLRHSPYEKTQLADGFYDLAISNVPFGNYQPYDKRFNAHKFVIHDYFFAASMERVRPGGLIVFITAKGTLDKKNGYLRRHLSKQADLVAAIRLPNTAFKENANTEVTTDLVILQKRFPGQSPAGPTWQESAVYTNAGGEEMLLNEYFVAHPRQMLGTMTLEGTMYGRTEAALIGDGRDLSVALGEAVMRLPENIYRSQRESSTPAVESMTIPAPDDIKPNAYALIETETGSQIAVREGDRLVPVPRLAGTTASRIRGMVRLRNTVRELGRRHRHPLRS
jgi:predicted O-methyltransferase YrrM